MILMGSRSLNSVNFLTCLKKMASLPHRFALKTTIAELEKEFAASRITPAAPGFYDSPAFISREQRQPDFLENYAAYVQLRPYDEAYLERARREIPVICEVLYKELAADGRQGACVDMSIALGRILEAEGLWCYYVKGSLTIEFPKSSGLANGYFWAFDLGGRDFAAPHAWISAPPFNILDLTLKQQPYPHQAGDWLPAVVMQEAVARTKATPEDLLSPTTALVLRSQRIKDPIRYVSPNFDVFTEVFSANLVKQGQLQLKYIPVAISAPDAPLEELGGINLRGRKALAIYRELVQPALAELRSAKP